MKMRITFSTFRARAGALLCLALTGLIQTQAQEAAMTRAPIVNRSVAESETDANVKAPQPSKGAQSAQNSNSSAFAPLNARSKLEYGLREAFFNPGSYVGPAIGALITQHR